MSEKFKPLAKPVSYTHLRAHETVLDLVCRLLLEKNKQQHTHTQQHISVRDNTTLNHTMLTHLDDHATHSL